MSFWFPGTLVTLFPGPSNFQQERDILLEASKLATFNLPLSFSAQRCPPSFSAKPRKTRHRTVARLAECPLQDDPSRGAGGQQVVGVGARRILELLREVRGVPHGGVVQKAPHTWLERSKGDPKQMAVDVTGDGRASQMQEAVLPCKHC